MAVNIGLYRPRSKLWAMTERSRSALSRSATALQIGTTTLCTSGDGLQIDVDEITAPIPRRIRGHIRLIPQVSNRQVFMLEPDGGHSWWPIAPAARVEVHLEQPDLKWSGHGYLDHNRGDRPLQRDFMHWHWARGRDRNGAAILYEMVRRDGSRHRLALRSGQDGLTPFEAPPVQAMPSTGWRISRSVATSAGESPAVIRTLEDTPFYARSLIRTRLQEDPLVMVHESLSLTRFAHPVVQAMLPFRMPRRR